MAASQVEDIIPSSSNTRPHSTFDLGATRFRDLSRPEYDALFDVTKEMNERVVSAASVKPQYYAESEIKFASKVCPDKLVTAFKYPRICHTYIR